MPDREKVIRWLEACSTGCEYGCPYEYEGTVVRYECKADLMRDALELLKETTRHVRHYSRPNVYADLWLHCEKCGGKIDDRFHFKYCPECGRKVEWDD